jgi:hypothetical protein
MKSVSREITEQGIERHIRKYGGSSVELCRFCRKPAVRGKVLCKSCDLQDAARCYMAAA